MSHNPKIEQPYIPIGMILSQVIERIKETTKMAKPMKPMKPAKPPKKPMKPGY